MFRSLLRRIAVHSLRPDCFPAVHLLFWVLMLGMIWFSFRTLLEANHSLHVRLALSHLEQAILTEESGQRGYLLTGNRMYWERFDTGRQRVPIYFTELEILIPASSQNFRHIERAREMLQHKEAEMQATIVLFDANQPSEALALVRSNQGEDNTRAITAELNQVEQESQSRFWTGLAWLSTSLLPLLGLRSSFFATR